MKIKIPKGEQGEKLPIYNLPEVNIYPNNRWGNIARKQGLQTARDWRAVKNATTEGINKFGSSIANPLYTISSFLTVVGDGQDVVDFYKSYKNKEIIIYLYLAHNNNDKL